MLDGYGLIPSFQIAFDDEDSAVPLQQRSALSENSGNKIIKCDSAADVLLLHSVL